ncbi:NADH:flavin oxidoreductase/NADH oxidase [Myroides sp. WP-1]|uniref:NADH:flavin oxidoreductase/NADH oxidase n=1 Tax=Myroides sp. WP-1 TaxID=2759944 RepID=UPI0015FB04C4|nr:NADH:flavin oxidoreductase/NADH oxidase [Myroides sp. WP-1]MBB1139765.1 NADH:flavin oxidoreductase/NADH oxidase [Myroides sp. WP-1]
MSLLFSSLRLKNHTLKNRIIVSPMCQYSATDGFATDWHLVHLGQFATGQVAAIIQEATAVVPEGRITYGDLGIWSDEHIEKLQQITKFIKAQNCIPGIQLAHAGRKASCEKPWITRDQIAPNQHNGWQTVAPSTIPFNDNDHPPLALTKEEIKQTIDAFKQATVRSIQAGYEIIELHGAHGYLIHQFFSPLINNRTDEYGGSFANRIRFLLEIIEAVQPVLTTQSLWVRISATDWAEGGWTLEESVALAQILQEKGVEVIDVSTGGGVRHQKITTGPNYQVPYAAQIKANTTLPVGAVGEIKTGPQAEAILQQNEADLIFIARELLRDPHFAMTAAQQLGEEIPWAPQYERGKE